MWNNELRKTYAVSLLVEHKRCNGPTSFGTSTSLATNANSGTAPAVLILGAGDGMSGHRHDRVSGSSREVEITGVVDGGMTSQWCSLYPFPVRTIARPERTDHLVSSGSDPTSITELSGHVIFQFLFQPILRSFHGPFPFHFTNVSLMTLRSHQSRTKRVYYKDMLTMCRTKHGPIK